VRRPPTYSPPAAASTSCRRGKWSAPAGALADVQRAAGSFSEADATVAKALVLYDEKGNVAAADRLRAGLVSS
jgi:hypothetical protein